MKGSEIREKFLTYFKERGHELVESSSLVPQDDPTLLFVNSGMVQFKRVFTGEEKRPYSRATTAQRSVRAGGKHNDLENVGYTARHHTFFEMLGNFSFGDYFKEEAINYAWEFLTKVLPLPKEKLWITIFDDDDEAESLWQKVDGLLPGRIVRMGEKDNFWAMGDTGPCGPCSEIHYDQGPEAGCGSPDCKLGCDCDRFLELWNLVFMQFERDAAGKLSPLPKPSIDTGMGLERIAAVLQGKLTNYDSDIFTEVIAKISEVTGAAYGKDAKTDTALRVIADHCRATTFLIADGVLPSNEGRGYVLRRVMRRAIRYGRTLGMSRPFLSAVTSGVVEQMSEAYPHLRDSVELLDKVVVNEEERFLETIDNGLAMLNQELQRMRKSGEKTIAGDFIFKLYDTYGFPVDIVKDVSQEENFEVDEAGFNRAMEQQRSQSKKSWKGNALSVKGKGLGQLSDKVGKTRFVGYETRRANSIIKALLDDEGELTAQAGAGQEVLIVCPESPFYAESGGQIGDHGEIIGPNGKARVYDTVATPDRISLHKAKIIEGALAEEDAVELRVAEGRRQHIAANHSATHLLQAVLREILGEHVKQSGSLVEEERLRFDFTHFSPMTPEEIEKVEARVNEEIRANTQMCAEVMDREAAQKSGATALFGEKYDEEVRVVTFGSLSKEFCGGTHVGATGEIGLFKITNETGIAAGVRRIVAVTGPESLARCQQQEAALLSLADILKTSPDKLEEKVKALVGQQKNLEKEIGKLTARLSMAELDSMVNNAAEIGGAKVVTARITLDSPKTLRDVGDKVRDKMGTGVAVLGGDLQGKVALLAIVSKDLTEKCHAGNIIKETAKIVGGSGGGRPDMAQAGGSMVDKLPEALASARRIIESQLSQ